MDHASWRKVLAINLDGVFNCTKVFLDQMLKQSYGRVVNITSVIGQIGNFGQANYAASKAGVAAFTKSLAKELAGKGITVNAVAPGFIETEMVGNIPERVRNRLLDQIPLKRFGRAEEVARSVIFIVSSDGDYITGAEDPARWTRSSTRSAGRHPGRGLAEHLVQAPAERRDPVFQPVQTFVELDELLGDGRHLRARGQVEGLERGLHGLLGQTLARCLAHQPLIERRAHHLGEGLGAHGLTEGL
jgi:hypothetical protein